MTRYALFSGLLMVATGSLTGALLGTVNSTHALAGEEVCLTKSRLQSWRPIDENTLEMTDKQMKRYTVRMQGSCANLTYTNPTLVYRYWGNLSCLNSSVLVRVAVGGRGALSCRVASVEEQSAPSNP